MLIDSGAQSAGLSGGQGGAETNAKTDPFLINTETHNDHTTGYFVFAPPAAVIASAGDSGNQQIVFTPRKASRISADTIITNKLTS